MFKLHPDTVKQIDAVIIPEIREAVARTRTEFEKKAVAQEGNTPNIYMTGYACWKNIYTRLLSALHDHPFFHIDADRRVLRIFCKNGKTELTFYIFHINKDTRISYLGKNIKIQLYEQFFLSEEIKNSIFEKASSLFILGYTMDRMYNLGQTTFEALTYISRNTFQSTTLHVFGSMIGTFSD